MAKISKKILKDIVKECLVEILAEGLASNSRDKFTTPILKESRKPRRKAQPKSLRPALDNIRMQPIPSKNEIPISVQPFIQHQDSLMSEIFADTARNTLMNQHEADRKGSYATRLTQGDSATKEMIKNDPTDLFKGAANWAALAFADSIKK